MSKDEPASNVERELLVSHESSVRIEEIEGNRVARFTVPPGMRGHTFAVELSDPSSPEVPTGPFRLEFALGSEFVIYEDKLPINPVEAGYSHFVLAPRLADATMSLKYSDTKTPGIVREARMTFATSENILQRLIVETDEPDLSTAIRHIGQIVADLLDALALVRRVPISIRHIDVAAPGHKFHRRYITLPYGQHTLTEADLKEAQNFPARLRGAVRLFREGVSSSRPPYRLLCLYRIREVIEKVRAETDREILAGGGTPNRPVRVLPANELTEFYFPQFVNKKVGAFLDHVRSEYRLAIAHGNLDDYFKLVLDPADVRIDHRIDFTNAALLPVVAEMIRDEAALINLAAAQSST
jgi:hypothetical protein